MGEYNIVVVVVVVVVVVATNAATIARAAGIPSHPAPARRLGGLSPSLFVQTAGCCVRFVRAKVGF